MASVSDEFACPPWLKSKLVVLDFDKTITNRHTRGAIFQPSGLDEHVLLQNFADIEFLRKFVPAAVRAGAKVCIATFADTEAESLLSGLALVRRYLDVAFNGKSANYIPDEHIEAWNPENRELDMKVVGKNMHLDNIVARVSASSKKSDVFLFDDSERNCLLARKVGYSAYFVEPASADDDGRPVKPNTGFCHFAWTEFLKEQQKKRGDGCVLS